MARLLSVKDDGTAKAPAFRLGFIGTLRIRHLLLRVHCVWLKCLVKNKIKYINKTALTLRSFIRRCKDCYFFAVVELSLGVSLITVSKAFIAPLLSGDTATKIYG